MKQKKASQKGDPEEEGNSEDEEDSNEEGDEDLSKTKTSKLTVQDDFDESRQITRGRMGIMLPDKNAFDFVVRVDKKEVSIKDKKKEAESGKFKLQKTLLQLRKSNTKPTTNKGMATVKIGF